MPPFMNYSQHLDKVVGFDLVNDPIVSSGVRSLIYDLGRWILVRKLPLLDSQE